MDKHTLRDNEKEKHRERIYLNHAVRVNERDQINPWEDINKNNDIDD